MKKTEPNENTIKKLSQLLQAKKISARELTQAYLEKIKQHNPKLNMYITITEETAIASAIRADELLKKGETHSPLLGIPIAVKDVLVTKNIRTTAGSKMLDEFIPPYESTTIARLNKAGAIMLGKTNCDAFAFGASTENSGYGATKNPWNTAKVPGGSSGGSAAAVAADCAVCAIGTDTGGSIRQPAALCGIVGLKLTYGRASRYGLIAMASSFDTPGPMTKTVEDAAIVAQTIAGYDENDGTTVKKEVPDYTKSLQKNLSGIKIGVLEESFMDGVENGVKSTIQTAIKELEKLGAKIKHISLPKLLYAIAAYYILVPSEISSNMARYDSVRFGYRSQNAKTIYEMQTYARGEALEDEVKRRIMLGNYALSAGYYDAYYLKAAKVRTVIKQEFENTLQDVDALICPTSPTVAFEIGAKANDPLAMYLADIFTVSANLAGIPGLSIPCGFSDNMPVGLQILGRAFDEETILKIGYAYEQATEWHRKFPEIDTERTTHQQNEENQAKGEK